MAWFTGYLRLLLVSGVAIGRGYYTLLSVRRLPVFCTKPQVAASLTKGAALPPFPLPLPGLGEFRV